MRRFPSSYSSTHSANDRYESYYRYHVNPKTLGYTTCTYIGVRLEKGSMYKDVVPELEKIPEVVECHFTTGPYTMLCKLYARDNEHLMHLINDHVQQIAFRAFVRV